MSIKKFHILVFCWKDLSSKAIGCDRRNWNLKNSMSLPVSVRFSCEIGMRLIVVENSPNQFDFAIKRNTSLCLSIWDQTSYCLGWEMMKSYSRNTFPSVQEILVHLFTCRLPAGAHCSATPSQTSTFPKKSFHFVNVQLAENRMCSNSIFKYSSNIGSIQTKIRISICQTTSPAWEVSSFPPVTWST